MIWRRHYDIRSLNILGCESVYYYTGGFNIAACTAWGVGIVVGPLATGIFASTSLGYLLGAAVSVLLFLVLRPLFLIKEEKKAWNSRV